MSFCCCINFICLSFVTFYKKEKALLQWELQTYEQNVERKQKKKCHKAAYTSAHIQSR